MFQLTIQCGGGEARSYLLNRESMTMGSGSDCDVVISSPFVAPLVARLEWEEGKGFRLQAAPGQRSLTVNGHPVLSILLKDGDEIRSGQFAGTLSAVADGLKPAWLESPPDGSETEEPAYLQEPENPVVPQPPGLAGLRLPLPSILEETPQEPPKASAALETPMPEPVSEHIGFATPEPQPDSPKVSSHVQERSGSPYVQERGDAPRQITELHERMLLLEKRLLETEVDARRRVERAHETIANLRKVIVQQDGELREQRQNLLKLQQAKNTAETQLESIRKAYTRERRQHGRLIDQFRERARRETARADRALDELDRARQAAADPD